MARRVRHDHYHHRGGGDGQWILWLIGLAVAVMLLRVLFWIAVVVIGAWLVYVLRRPILISLVILWRGLSFVLRTIGGLFRRGSSSPKLIALPKSISSDS